MNRDRPAPGPRRRREPRRRAASDHGDRLRTAVQGFFRASGVLSMDRTPCGKPLAVSHAHALMMLLEHGRRGERPTQQQLGDRLGIDKSNVARLCQKMESAGHLAQVRSPEDGRARLLALTERGARLASEVEQASRARFQRLCQALPARDRARVVAALATLNAALAAAANDRPDASGLPAFTARRRQPPFARKGGSP